MVIDMLNETDVKLLLKLLELKRKDEIAYHNKLYRCTKLSYNGIYNSLKKLEKYGLIYRPSILKKGKKIIHITEKGVIVAEMIEKINKLIGD